MRKRDIRKTKRTAALAFWSVASAFGAFGTEGALENVALFGDEPTATAERKLEAEGKDGELESPTGFKAFLVGADDYADALDLRFVKNDVEAFAARLVEIGFDEKNIVVLKTGGDFSLFPTKANIESRFRTFLKTLRPGDFVVVYLSGHGLRSAETGESFFAPIDVKPLDPFKTSVSIDKILAALARSKANFRWAIVDACRNDPTGSTSGSPSAIFQTRTSGAAKALTEITDAPSSVALLQSCQPGRVSFEGDGDLKNGLFTLGLLEALDPKGTKADVDQNGALTFTEVLKYVSERTNELAGECYGESQTPCWSGSFTDFAILTDLRKDGLAREDWERAEALYCEAAALRRERRYREAAEKLDLATAINKNNAEYAAARAELAELLESRTAAQEARKAAETAADGWIFRFRLKRSGSTLVAPERRLLIFGERRGTTLTRIATTDARPAFLGDELAL